MFREIPEYTRFSRFVAALLTLSQNNDRRYQSQTELEPSDIADSGTVSAKQTQRSTQLESLRRPGNVQQ